MSTLGHQYDNSLVSNAFGFLRLPMNFQPYDHRRTVRHGNVRSCGWTSWPGGNPSGFHQPGLGAQPLPVELRHARAPERGGLR